MDPSASWGGCGGRGEERSTIESASGLDEGPSRLDESADPAEGLVRTTFHARPHPAWHPGRACGQEAPRAEGPEVPDREFPLRPRRDRPDLPPRRLLGVRRGEDPVVRGMDASRGRGRRAQTPALVAHRRRLPAQARRPAGEVALRRRRGAARGRLGERGAACGACVRRRHAEATTAVAAVAAMPAADRPGPILPLRSRPGYAPNRPSPPASRSVITS